MAVYYIDGSYGNDSTGDGSAATPWKSLTKYHESVFYNASTINDVLVLSGIIALNPATENALGLGTHGAWLAGSRIFDFGNTNGNTAKTAGSKIDFRARTRYEAAPTGGVTRPPVISPWIQCTGSVTSDATTTGIRTISTQTANLPTYSAFTSSGRIARVAYRPYDAVSGTSYGLPGCRFRRAKSAQSFSTTAATAVASAITMGSTDDGTTGLNIGTFLHNTANNTIIVNAATAANGATVASNIAASTTIGNWYFSVDDNGGVTGLGIQCNTSNGAGSGFTMTGITFLDCVSSVGTGHSAAGFDATSGIFRNIRVINCGSHAIAFSNSRSAALNANGYLIEDFQIDGMAGGTGQGNSAIYMGGGGNNDHTIVNARVRRGAIRLFNHLRHDGVPLARAACSPFRFFTPQVTGKAGVRDVQVDDVDVMWVPGLTSDLGTVVGSLYGSSGNISQTNIFSGGGNTPTPTAVTTPDAYPIRFNRCTFTGMKVNRMDSGDSSASCHSAAFVNCTLDASDYGRAMDSGFNPGWGGIGVLSISNSCTGLAASELCRFLFLNCNVIGRCGGTGTQTTRRSMIYANFAAYRATAYTAEFYFRNSNVGFTDIYAQNSGGAIPHVFVNYDANGATDAFTNGVYVDAEKCNLFYDLGFFREDAGLDRVFLRKDANATPRFYNNTYWNMASTVSANDPGSGMSSGRSATIGNIRGNWLSGTGGDPLATIEMGPLPFSINRRSVPPITAPYSDSAATGHGTTSDTVVRVSTDTLHPMSRRRL